MKAPPITPFWIGAGILLGLCFRAQAAKYPLVDFPQLKGVTARDVFQDSGLCGTMAALPMMATFAGLVSMRQAYRRKR